MKIARFLSVFVLMLFALTLMTGCRCVPSGEKWYFYSYRAEMEFLNGVKLTLGFSDASQAFPFAGASCDNIAISFTKDGKVEFTDADGVTHLGTYTYEHVKSNYTNFTITLENGEKIEGSSMKSGKKAKLSIEYKGVFYNFRTENSRSGIKIEDVIKQILDGDIGDLHEAKALKTENGFSVQFNEFVSYPIKEGTAAYAIKIKADGTYEILDEIVEGDVLSTYNNEADYIVLYYIEK